MLRGNIDRAEGLVSGWAYDDARPGDPIELTVFVDGSPVTTVRADQNRPDLAVLATGHTTHGFVTPPIPNLTQEDTVFAKYNGQYIVPGTYSRDFHLTHRLNHTYLLSKRFSPHEIVESGPVPCSDVQLGRRMIRALALGLGRTSTTYGPLWGILKDTHHGHVIALAERNDPQGLLDYLSTLGRQPFALGFFDGPDADQGARHNPAFRAAAGKVIFDRLLSLSESVCSSNVENPEQGPWGEKGTVSPDSLFCGVLKKLGLPAVIPSVGCYWGLETSAGVVNARVLDGLHFAHRIATVRRHFKLNGVTEIGGGAGLAASLALGLGCRPYRIVDLPTVSLAQAYTLREREDLLLDGDTFVDQQALLTTSFDNPTTHVFDMLVNTDSLPEIETTAALAYLERAREDGYRLFLSINQESGNQVDRWTQNKVSELTRRVGGYRAISRHRDWMRPGYVEEVYQIES